MSFADVRLSFADLSAAGVRPRASEAVAIVRHIALQVASGDLPGVPSAHVIRFTPSGEVTIEGPVSADGPDVSRAALLLDTILGGVNEPPEFRASGALRIVVARALGALDLPPYTSLGAFADALSRFAAADVSSTVRELCAAWSAAMRAETIAGGESKADSAKPSERDDAGDAFLENEDLTISDIRRARRETRLTLAEVAERSRIPAWLLRELEWGYFRNWPGGLYGRTQLVRYARAAGLDEPLVVRTVWPLIAVAARRRGTQEVAPEDLQPADPQQVNAAAMLVPIERGPLVPLTLRATARHQYRLAAAVAIGALLTVALIPGAWERWSQKRAIEARPDAVASRAPAEPAGDPATTPGATDPATARPDSTKDPAATRPDSTSRPTVERSAPIAEPAIERRAPIRPQAIDSPGFADVGTATFQPDDVPGVVPASHDGAMMLRVARVVDDGARNYHARMSPDGRHIAFDSDRDGERGVYVADADGRNVRRVSGDGFAALPGWAPDGRTLLYVRGEPEARDVWNLWKVDVGNGRRERLTSHRSGQPWGGSWFPDGRHIAYSRDSKLVVLDTETRRETEFPSPVRGRPIRSPAVSPDGQHVVFHVLRDGAWLLGVPSGSTRRLIDDPSADAFSWAPDGRRFAYYSGRSGRWNVWLKLGSW